MREFSLAEQRNLIYQEVNDELVRRISRGLLHLVQELVEAYDKVLTLKGGNAVSSLTYEIKRTGTMIEAIVGPGEAGKYLAFLEFGEHGTQGSPMGGAFYSRSKAPPVRNIYQWILRAGIAAPQMYMTQAAQNARRAAGTTGRKHPKFDQKKNAPWYSSDPRMLFAFAIAMKRKRLGRAALRVLERTVQAQTARMQEIINQ